jgi:hypothetical protein
MWYARLAWFVVQGARRLTGAEPDEGSEEARYARILFDSPAGELGSWTPCASQMRGDFRQQGAGMT